MASGGQRPHRPNPNGEFDEEAGLEHPGRTPSFQKQVSHYDLDFNEQLNEQHIKDGFIRKVYAILGVQMAYTTLICGGMTYHSSFGEVGLWVMGHGWLMLIPMVCIICGLHKNKDIYPTNLMLLTALTTLIAFNIGGVCYSFHIMGKGDVVLAAVAVTAVVFFTLTALVWIVGDKFGWLGNFLFTALMANIMFCFLAYLLALPGMMVLYNIFGVLIFTGYILYDTNQIVNKVKLSDADTGTAIMGAVELYLDIVNLFLHILSLLGRAD
jgi:hypothetical protein